MSLKSIFATATVLAGFALQPALAAPSVTVKISEIDIGAPITTSATGGSTASITTGAQFGAFTLYDQTVTGVGGSSSSVTLLDLDAVLSQFTQGGNFRSLSIAVVENGLTSPFVGTGLATVIHASLAPGSMLLAKTYFDATDTVTVDSTGAARGTALLGTAGKTITASGDYTYYKPLTSPTSGTYALAEFFYISEGPGGSSTFSSTLETFPVPEPMTLALLGTGVLGLAAVARRRRG